MGPRGEQQQDRLHSQAFSLIFANIKSFDSITKERFVLVEGETPLDTHMIVYFCSGTIQSVSGPSEVKGELLFAVAEGDSCLGAGRRRRCKALCTR